MKPGIAVEIPGFGRLALELLVSDYTGTLCRGGKLSAATATCRWLCRRIRQWQ